MITGAGGMGLAVARRLGSGHRILLGDHSKEALGRAARTLDDDEGYFVTTAELDISDPEQVIAFAKQAASLGPLRTIRSHRRCLGGTVRTGPDREGRRARHRPCCWMRSRNTYNPARS